MFMKKCMYQDGDNTRRGNVALPDLHCLFHICRKAECFCQNDHVFNACELFTVQPVVSQGGVYVQLVPLVYLILVRVQLWSLLCCRFSCCLCFSSFHVLLLSFTLEYLLLISEEIALILLSRSCFMVAFSGKSAWDLRQPASELSCKQLKLFR